MGDVWEIGVLAPISRERTGYPSQKPVALLERLIGALTSPGDSVLDPYAGSGTTLAAARSLGRSYMGIDASDVAIETIKERLGPFVSPDGSSAAEPLAPELTPMTSRRKPSTSTVCPDGVASSVISARR
jgi:hypothetical protein